MDDHEGADAIERAWRDGLTPDPLLPVSEWADRYRVLSQRASSEPGRSPHGAHGLWAGDHLLIVNLPHRKDLEANRQRRKPSSRRAPALHVRPQR
jgi:hypothetical protein